MGLPQLDVVKDQPMRRPFSQPTQDVVGLEVNLNTMRLGMWTRLICPAQDRGAGATREKP